MRLVSPHWTHLQGQAGVCAVMAQLLLRGHVPCVPSVDYGFDLMLDNGLKLQVKSAKLGFGMPSYPCGVYRFEAREGFRLNAKRGVMNHLERRDPRSWKGLADFFVFWAVNENRFFVMPSSEVKGAVYLSPKFAPQANCGRAECKTTIFKQFEDRWDLLDVNNAVESVLQAVRVTADSGTATGAKHAGLPRNPKGDTPQ